MTDLSIIIVNYNVRDFLEQALLSVRKAVRDIPHEIIVVDNASTDGSVRMVRERFPDVILIANSVNAGFARANNQAMKLAKGRFISLLNPDTLVKEDTFSVILDAFGKHSEAGMIGCRVLNPDGSLQLSCRRSFPTPWVSITRLLGLSWLFPKNRLFGRYNLTYLDPDSAAEVDAISGSFMNVRREVIESAGMLDERFFMYGEDLEWCYQIKERGWKIMYIPDTSIVHYKGESSRQSNWNQLKLFYRAMVIFSEKHFRSYSVFTPFWLLKFAIWLRAFVTLFGRAGRSLFVPVADVVMINAAVLAAFYMRFGELVELPVFGDYRDYILIGGISSVILLISLFIQGVYPRHRYSVRRSFYGAVWGSMIAALVIFFSRWLAVSRIVLVLSAALQILFLAGWRQVLKLVVHLFAGGKFMPFSDELRPVRNIIIGTDSASVEIFQRFGKHPLYSRQAAGLVSTDDTPPPPGVPVLGHVSELLKIVREHNITDIIFAASSHSYNRIIDTVTLCQPARVSFKLVPDSLQLIIGKSSVVPLGEVPLVDIEYKFFEGTNRVFKRLIDIIVAGTLIVVTFPAYMFVKWRKGLRSEFRLVLGERGTPLYVRRVMRKDRPYTGRARLFPLWIHVLAGELSLVGTPVFTDTPELPQRLSLLKPGIISLDAVDIETPSTLNGHTFELTYLKNYTILYDLKIIFRAIVHGSARRSSNKPMEVDNSHS